ncbi:unnamed protein product [Acanthoscelides obtectus]|uniref:Reverse transcriptase domain-containing protein n=1 Tax=Acanthoscelides obtectus TaxID=200917 RepID=A0A9P0LPB7_ACAOB|nr:unnamed protein product [Acanthoscelides obtectus]CAK1625988.1 Probable RNA-directed DNA polymerase from transposon X-element [Acanthoscelides obtectus]
MSTESGCIDPIQYISDRLDRAEFVLTISFELTRAFDTVDKIFVKNKMENMGLRGSINFFIFSYLSGRRFAVKIGESVSDYYNQDIGTPQGSVLGPRSFCFS